jgi:broad specificity phosphatase PhoE
MLTLFYSPHMTSVDNEAGRASGHADVPLSDAGRKQALELGQHYQQEALDAVFCSDLQRAAITAELAFSARALPIVPDTRLRECDYGEMTQHPRLQVEAESARRITAPFPNGESMQTVVERVGAFLRDALRDYDEKSIVVIGHRATKYGLEYWCGGTSLEKIVLAPWEWRQVPIWRYELYARNLEKN